MRVNPLTISILTALTVFTGNAFASNETVDSHANTLLQLAAETELANAQTRVATAKLEARQAQQKLASPIKGKNAVERTTSQGSQRSPIDNIEIKSLVTTNGVTTAWIALEGELIEVKNGSKVGAISIINLNENSILFSDGHKQKRKWMAGFKRPASPQVVMPRGR